jgi:hypothetical protein
VLIFATELEVKAMRNPKEKKSRVMRFKALIGRRVLEVILRGEGCGWLDSLEVGTMFQEIL